jgi:multiple sugar transport system substrate-binding protein
MKLHRKRAVVAALAMTLMTGLAACSEDDGATNSDGEGTGSSDVTVITVMGMPAATNEQALKLFQDQVAAFEAENPDIRVVGSDVPWDVKTFAPRLAGGSAPTLLRVPLTEPAALIDNGQVADISAEAHALDGYESLNPRVMEFLERDGATYGLPEKAYAFGLAYNRGLFAEQAHERAIPSQPPSLLLGGKNDTRGTVRRETRVPTRAATATNVPTRRPTTARAASATAAEPGELPVAAPAWD